jgi:hypothetical protein
MPTESWMLLAGAVSALAGMVLAITRRQAWFFWTATGAALCGTGFLLARIDVFHVLAAVFAYGLGLAAAVMAGLKERKGYAE